MNVDRYGLSAQYDFAVEQSTFARMDKVVAKLNAIEQATNSATKAIDNSKIGDSLSKIGTNSLAASQKISKGNQKLQDSLKEVNRRIKPLKQEYRAIVNEARNINWGDLLDAKQFSKAEKQTGKYIKQLNVLKNQVKGNTAAERAFVAQLKRQKNIMKANIDLQKKEREIAKFSYRIGEAKVLGSIGRNAIVPFKRIAADGIATLAEFDDRMSSVEAVSGASSEQMDKLRDSAKKLGSSTRFSASQVAEAQAFLAMAGLKSNQILDGQGSALNLAAAGSLELAEAADIASNVMSAFNLEAAEMSRVADVLAKTASTTNTSVSQMGEAFKFAAPSAKQFGATMEETAALIGIAGNVGIQGSLAGTGARAGFINLTKGSVQEKLDEYFDVSTVNPNGTARNIISIIGDIKNALNTDFRDPQFMQDLQSINSDIANGVEGADSRLKELSDSYPQYAAGLSKLTDVVGKTSVAFWGAQISQYDALQKQALTEFAAGIDEKELAKYLDIDPSKDLFAEIIAQARSYEEALDVVRDGVKGLIKTGKGGEGAASMMARIMEQNLAGSFRSLGSAIEAFKIAYFEPLKPLIIGIVKTISFLLKTLANIPAPIRFIASSFGVLIVVAAALIAGIGALAVTLFTFSRAANIAAIAQGNLARGAAIPLTGFFETSMTSGFEATSPIATLTKNYKKLLSDFQAGGKQTLGASLEGLKVWANQAVAFFRIVGVASKSLLMNPVTIWVGGFILLNAVVENIIPGFNMLGVVLSGLAAPFGFIFGLIKGLLKSVFKITAMTGKGGLGAIAPIFNTIGNAISQAAKAFNDFSDRGEAIGEMVGDLILAPFISAARQIGKAWTGLVVRIRTLLKPLVDFARSIGEGLIRALNCHPTIVIPNSWQGAVDSIIGFFDGLITPAKKVAGSLISIFNSAIGHIVGFAKTTVGAGVITMILSSFAAVIAAVAPEVLGLTGILATLFLALEKGMEIIATAAFTFISLQGMLSLLDSGLLDSGLSAMIHALADSFRNLKGSFQDLDVPIIFFLLQRATSIALSVKSLRFQLQELMIYINQFARIGLLVSISPLIQSLSSTISQLISSVFRFLGKVFPWLDDVYKIISSISNQILDWIASLNPLLAWGVKTIRSVWSSLKSVVKGFATLVQPIFDVFKSGLKVIGDFLGKIVAQIIAFTSAHPKLVAVGSAVIQIALWFLPLASIVKNTTSAIVLLVSSFANILSIGQSLSEGNYWESFTFGLGFVLSQIGLIHQYGEVSKDVLSVFHDFLSLSKYTSPLAGVFKVSEISTYRKVFSELVNVVLGFVQSVTIIDSQFGNIFDSFVFPSVFEDLQNKWSTTINFIKDKIGKLVSWLGGIKTAILHALAENSPGLTTIIRDAWGNTISFIGDGIKGLVGIAVTVGGAIAGALSTPFKAIGSLQKNFATATYKRFTTPLASNKDKELDKTQQNELFAKKVAYAPAAELLNPETNNYMAKYAQDFLNSQGFKIKAAKADYNTGFQALTLQNQADEKDIRFVITGTNENADILDDANQYIGKNQFENNQQWIGEHLSKLDSMGFDVTATGHSLGGALVQEIASVFGDKLDKIETFNSPGVSDAHYNQFGKLKQKPEVMHHINRSDFVSAGGGKFVPGDVRGYNEKGFQSSPMAALAHHVNLMTVSNEGIEQVSLTIDELNSSFYRAGIAMRWVEETLRAITGAAWVLTGVVITAVDKAALGLGTIDIILANTIGGLSLVIGSLMIWHQWGDEIKAGITSIYKGLWGIGSFFADNPFELLSIALTIAKIALFLNPITGTLGIITNFLLNISTVLVGIRSMAINLAGNDYLVALLDFLRVTEGQLSALRIGLAVILEGLSLLFPAITPALQGIKLLTAAVFGLFSSVSVGVFAFKYFRQIEGELKHAIAPVANAVADLIYQLNILGQIVHNYLAKRFPLLIAIFDRVFSGITNTVKTAVQNIVGEIATLVDAVLHHKLATELKRLISSTLASIVNNFFYFIDTVNAVGGKIHFFFEKYLPNLTELFDRTIGKAIGATISFIDNFVDNLSSLLGSIADLFSDLYFRIHEFLVDKLPGLTRLFDRIFGDIFKAIVNQFKTFFGGLGSLITAIINFDLGSVISVLMSAVFGTINSVLEAIFWTINTIIESVWTAISLVVSLPGKIINGIIQTIKTVDRLLRNLGATVSSLFVNIARNLLGKEIIGIWLDTYDVIIKGIKRLLPELKQQTALVHETMARNAPGLTKAIDVSAGGIGKIAKLLMFVDGLIVGITGSVFFLGSHIAMLITALVGVPLALVFGTPEQKIQTIALAIHEFTSIVKIAIGAVKAAFGAFQTIPNGIDGIIDGFLNNLDLFSFIAFTMSSIPMAMVKALRPGAQAMVKELALVIKLGLPRAIIMSLPAVMAYAISTGAIRGTEDGIKEFVYAIPNMLHTAIMFLRTNMTGEFRNEINSAVEDIFGTSNFSIDSFLHQVDNSLYHFADSVVAYFNRVDELSVAIGSSIATVLRPLLSIRVLPFLPPLLATFTTLAPLYEGFASFLASPSIKLFGSYLNQTFLPILLTNLGRVAQILVLIQGSVFGSIFRSLFDLAKGFFNILSPLEQSIVIGIKSAKETTRAAQVVGKTVVNLLDKFTIDDYLQIIKSTFRFLAYDLIPNLLNKIPFIGSAMAKSFGVIARTLGGVAAYIEKILPTTLIKAVLNDVLIIIKSLARGIIRVITKELAPIGSIFLKLLNPLGIINTIAYYFKTEGFRKIFKKGLFAVNPFDLLVSAFSKIPYLGDTVIGALRFKDIIYPLDIIKKKQQEAIQNFATPFDRARANRLGLMVSRMQILESSVPGFKLLIKVMEGFMILNPIIQLLGHIALAWSLWYAVLEPVNEQMLIGIARTKLWGVSLSPLADILREIRFLIVDVGNVLGSVFSNIPGSVIKIMTFFDRLGGIAGTATIAIGWLTRQFLFLAKVLVINPTIFLALYAPLRVLQQLLLETYRIISFLKHETKDWMYVFAELSEFRFEAIFSQLGLEAKRISNVLGHLYGSTLGLILNPIFKVELAIARFLLLLVTDTQKAFNQVQNTYSDISTSLASSFKRAVNLIKSYIVEIIIGISAIGTALILMSMPFSPLIANILAFSGTVAFLVYEFKNGFKNIDRALDALLRPIDTLHNMILGIKAGMKWELPSNTEKVFAAIINVFISAFPVIVASIFFIGIIIRQNLAGGFALLTEVTMKFVGSIFRAVNAFSELKYLMTRGLGKTGLPMFAATQMHSIRSTEQIGGLNNPLAYSKDSATQEKARRFGDNLKMAKELRRYQKITAKEAKIAQKEQLKQLVRKAKYGSTFEKNEVLGGTHINPITRVMTQRAPLLEKKADKWGNERYQLTKAGRMYASANVKQSILNDPKVQEKILRKSGLGDKYKSVHGRSVDPSYLKNISTHGIDSHYGRNGMDEGVNSRLMAEVGLGFEQMHSIGSEKIHSKFIYADVLQVKNQSQAGAALGLEKLVDNLKSNDSLSSDFKNSIARIGDIEHFENSLGNALVSPNTFDVLSEFATDFNAKFKSELGITKDIEGIELNFNDFEEKIRHVDANDGDRDALAKDLTDHFLRQQRQALDYVAKQHGVDIEQIARDSNGIKSPQQMLRESIPTPEQLLRDGKNIVSDTSDVLGIRGFMNMMRHNERIESKAIELETGARNLNARQKKLESRGRGRRQRSLDNQLNSIKAPYLESAVSDPRLQNILQNYLETGRTSYTPKSHEFKDFFRSLGRGFQNTDGSVMDLGQAKAVLSKSLSQKQHQDFRRFLQGGVGRSGISQKDLQKIAQTLLENDVKFKGAADPASVANLLINSRNNHLDKTQKSDLQKAIGSPNNSVRATDEELQAIADDLELPNFGRLLRGIGSNNLFSELTYKVQDFFSGLKNGIDGVDNFFRKAKIHVESAFDGFLRRPVNALAAWVKPSYNKLFDLMKTAVSASDSQITERIRATQKFLSNISTVKAIRTAKEKMSGRSTNVMQAGGKFKGRQFQNVDKFVVELQKQLRLSGIESEGDRAAVAAKFIKGRLAGESIETVLKNSGFSGELDKINRAYANTLKINARQAAKIVADPSITAKLQVPAKLVLLGELPKIGWAIGKNLVQTMAFGASLFTTKPVTKALDLASRLVFREVAPVVGNALVKVTKGLNTKIVNDLHGLGNFINNVVGSNPISKGLRSVAERIRKMGANAINKMERDIAGVGSGGFTFTGTILNLTKGLFGAIVFSIKAASEKIKSIGLWDKLKSGFAKFKNVISRLFKKSLPTQQKLLPPAPAQKLLPPAIAQKLLPPAIAQKLLPPATSAMGEPYKRSPVVEHSLNTIVYGAKENKPEPQAQQKLLPMAKTLITPHNKVAGLLPQAGHSGGVPLPPVKDVSRAASSWSAFDSPRPNSYMAPVVPDNITVTVEAHVVPDDEPISIAAAVVPEVESITVSATVVPPTAEPAPTSPHVVPTAEQTARPSGIWKKSLRALANKMRTPVEQRRVGTFREAFDESTNLHIEHIGDGKFSYIKREVPKFKGMLADLLDGTRRTRRRMDRELEGSAEQTSSNWKNAVSSIKNGFKDTAAAASARGKEIVKKFSQNSPGPSHQVQQHWHNTNESIQHGMHQTARAAQVEGARIQRSLVGSSKAVASGFWKTGVAFGASVSAIGVGAQTIGFSLSNMGLIETDGDAMKLITTLGEISTIGGAISAVFAPLFQLMVSGFTTLIPLGEVLMAGVSGLGSAFAGLFGITATGFLPLLIGISVVIAAIGAIYWAFKTNFLGVGDLIRSVVATIKQEFQGAIEWLNQAWEKFGFDFDGRLQELLEPAKNVAQGLIDRLNHSPTIVIPESWRKATNNIKGYLDNVLQKGAEVGREVNNKLAPVLEEKTVKAKVEVESEPKNVFDRLSSFFRKSSTPTPASQTPVSWQDNVQADLGASMQSVRSTLQSGSDIPLQMPSPPAQGYYLAKRKIEDTTDLIKDNFANIKAQIPNIQSDVVAKIGKISESTVKSVNSSWAALSKSVGEYTSQIVRDQNAMSERIKHGLNIGDIFKGGFTVIGQNLTRLGRGFSVFSKEALSAIVRLDFEGLNQSAERFGAVFNLSLQGAIKGFKALTWNTVMFGLAGLATLSPVIVAFGVFLFTVGLLSFGLAVIVNNFLGLKSILKGLGLIVWGLGEIAWGVIKGLIISLDGLRMIVGGLFKLIDGDITLLWRGVDRLKEGIGIAFGSIASGLRKILKGIKLVAHGLLVGFAQTFGMSVDRALQKISNLWLILSNGVLAGDYVAAGLIASFKKLIRAVGWVTKTIFKVAIGGVKKVVRGIGKIFSVLFSRRDKSSRNIVGNLKWLFSKQGLAALGFGNPVRGIISLINLGLRKLPRVFSRIFKYISGFLSGFTSRIGTEIEAGLNSINIDKFVGSFKSAIKEGIGKSVETVIKNIKNSFADLINSVTKLKEKFEQIFSGAKNVGEKVKNGLTNPVKSIKKKWWGGAKDVTQSIETISNAAKVAGEEAESKLSHNSPGPTKMIPKKWDAAASLVKGSMRSIADVARLAGTEIRAANKNAVSDTISAYKKLGNTAKGTPSKPVRRQAEDVKQIERLTDAKNANARASQAMQSATMSVGSALSNFAPQLATPIFVAGDMMDAYRDLKQAIPEVAEALVLKGTMASAAAGVETVANGAVASSAAGAGAIQAEAATAAAAAEVGAGSVIAGVKATLIGWYTALGTAAASAGGMIKSSFAFLFTTPIGGAIVGIAAAVTALYIAFKYNFLNINDIIRTLIDILKAMLKPFTTIGRAIYIFSSTLISGVLGEIGEIFSIIGGTIGSVLHSILVGVTNLQLPLLQLFNLLFGRGGGGSLSGWASSIARSLVWVVSLVTSTVRIIGNSIAFIFRLLEPIGMWVGEVVMSYLGLMAVFSGMGALLGNFGAIIASFSGIIPIITFITNAVTGLVGLIAWIKGAFLITLLPAIALWLPPILLAIGAIVVVGGILKTVFNLVVAAITGTVRGFKLLGSEVFGALATELSGIWDLIKELGSRLIEPFAPLFELFGGGNGDGLMLGAMRAVVKAAMIPFKALAFVMVTGIKTLSLLIKGIIWLGAGLTALVLSPFRLIAATIVFIVEKIQGFFSLIGRIGSAIAQGIAAPFEAIVGGLSWIFGKIQGLWGGVFGSGDSPDPVSDPGEVQHFSRGGPVFGPGTGTSDSVSAMLSNGEFVVRAASAAKNMGALKFLNATGTLPTVDYDLSREFGLLKALELFHDLPEIVAGNDVPPIPDLGLDKASFEPLSRSRGVGSDPKIELNFTGDIIINSDSTPEMARQMLEQITPQLAAAVKKILRDEVERVR